MNQTLNKKLSMYALAGAALAVPGSAEAGIIHVTANQTVSNNNSIVVDISAPGAADLQLFASSYSFPPDSAGFEVTAASGTGGVLLDFFEVDNLPVNTLIDPATGFFATQGKLLEQETLFAPMLPPNGEWAATGTGYLGFYFTDPGGTYAAWARVSASVTTSSASVTLHEYAYNDVPGGMIRAGQTTLAAVPEPSTMALLALGGIGLLALRRRRSLNG